MEPSYNDFRQVLRRHEEIAQSNSLTLHHLSSRFWDFEQAPTNLAILRNQEIEATLTTLNMRMDGMESEIQQIKGQLNTRPMCINLSDKINL
jgi:hypothetical protein